ncbi:MAG: ATP-grasp domain-containing protein, partial [Bacteroidetes bacterium]|nr:ATP-grasp domain-containing protein [Bacteroidota bacterium]
FFLGEKEVYFSELSPRPHDTGMVTLAGTQNFSQFELHLRAILGLPLKEITLERSGASAVILSQKEIPSDPEYTGTEDALRIKNSNVKIFGKPSARVYRRMGVALTWDDKNSDINELRVRAKNIAGCVKIN